MILIDEPRDWVSAHRPCNYTFGFFPASLTSVTDNGGFAQFNIASPFSADDPVVGGKIYISTGDYAGEHTITEIVTNTQFVTSTAYSATSTGTLYHLNVPTFQLYKGYGSAEDYPDQLPLTLVATFTPEVSPSYNVQINLQGYLSSIFRITAPKTTGIDFTMFNRFRLRAVYTSITYEYNNRQVLNSSIKNDVLNADYVGASNYLNAQIPPVLFGCGRTILSTLNNNVVENVVITNATEPSDGAFNTDFNNDFDIL